MATRGTNNMDVNVYDYYKNNEDELQDEICDNASKEEILTGVTNYFSTDTWIAFLEHMASEGYCQEFEDEDED